MPLFLLDLPILLGQTGLWVGVQMDGLKVQQADQSLLHLLSRLQVAAWPGWRLIQLSEKVVVWELAARCCNCE